MALMLVDRSSVSIIWALLITLHTQVGNVVWVSCIQCENITNTYSTPLQEQAVRRERNLTLCLHVRYVQAIFMYHLMILNHHSITIHKLYILTHGDDTTPGAFSCSINSTNLCD